MPEQISDETTEEREVRDPNTSSSHDEVAETTDTTDETTTDETTEEEPETFPRAYVEQLRREAAEHRVKASDRDALAERLHTALVAATGRLADPSDLDFDEAHLTDEEALTTALDELLTRKPHLASRRVTGDVGQGASASSETVDLAGILRSRV